jgi:glycerol kinase
MYITVADRAMYLVGRLTEKNKKLLDSPDWSEEDYEELSGRLLEHVKSLQTKKKILKARIDYAKSVSQMADLSPLGVWASQDS